MIKLALVDDHILLRNGLADLLQSKGFEITLQADNGSVLVNTLSAENMPQLILMDINMPLMDGFETTKWLTKHYPDIKVIALSMYDNETNIIKMIRAGARGYVLKYADVNELINAINAIAQSGYYYSDTVNYKLLNTITATKDKDAEKDDEVELSQKEITFLKLCCTELSYKDIAEEMYLSPKTVENYREALCAKLNIHTRVGLAMYAVKHKLVQL